MSVTMENIKAIAFMNFSDKLVFKDRILQIFQFFPFTFFPKLVEIICQPADHTCAVFLSLLSQQQQLFFRCTQKSSTYFFSVHLAYHKDLHCGGIKVVSRIINV